MKRVTIINNKNGRQFGAIMEDPSEWISSMIAKNSWGLPEREVKSTDANEWEIAHTKSIITKEELVRNMKTNIDELLEVEYRVVEAEYIIEIEDISNTEDDPRWIEMRNKRDALITATDFTQLPDCSLSDSKKAQFKTYRQALRDFPSTIIDISNYTFPTKPE